MSRRPYIGVTGFMSSAEVRAALDAFPPHCGRDLMVGVLASSKTLYGRPNKYPRRYPLRDDIASVFVNDARCLNLVHYATGGEQDAERLADDLLRAMMAGGPLCHGLQINAAWPSPYALELFRHHHPSVWIVLQIGPDALAEMDRRATAIMRRVRDYGSTVTDILIDASGGMGQPLDVEMARRIGDKLREAGGWGIGVAGGLCVDAIPRVAGLLRDGVSIDAEGRLRDDADGGGNLDLAEVRAYLAAAGRAVSL